MTDQERVQPDIPADNGKRPSIERDGSVRGSGVGAGGGQKGEDFGDDRAGDGYPLTGVEGDEQPD